MNGQQHHQEQQQSRSMHDLSSIRQPPGYSEAVQHQQRHPNRRDHHKPRWTTISGVDPQMMAQISSSSALGYPFHQARSEPRLDIVCFTYHYH